MKVRKFDCESYVIDHNGRRFFVVNVGIVGSRKKSYQVTELGMISNQPKQMFHLLLHSLKSVKETIKKEAQ